MVRPTAEGGFTLVGLMVAVLVINIALGVAVTAASHVDRRAREAETIFRGQQIVRALGCFREAEQRRAERLEELVEAGCLRRDWDDPMSSHGRWRLLTQQDLADGTVAALLGTATEGAAEGEAADPFANFRSFGASGFGASNGGAGPSGNDDSREGLFGSTQSTQQGIVGVTPGATGPSLRIYNGRSRYEEWVFLAEGAPPAGG